MPAESVSPAIEVELNRIRELSKSTRHTEALAAAIELVAAAPHNRDARYLVAANQRCLNRINDALTALRRLEEEHPRFSLLYQERGYCYVSLKDAPMAIAAFARAVNLNPALAASWTMLERLYSMMGDEKSRAAAAEQLRALNLVPPAVVQAASLFSDGDLAGAETILRASLREDGNNAEALRLLGRIEHQGGVLDEAERLLEAALKLSPDYRAARLDYVRVLLERQKYREARDEASGLLRVDPGDTDCLSMRAAACAGLGQHEEAIEQYRVLLSGAPDSAELHLAYGHSLKSAARWEEAIKTYRAAASLRPGFGDAWWSLANLKAYRFSEDEIAAMRAEETAAQVHAVDRTHLCFALGKAYEDRGEYAESWQFYARGNALRRTESRYHPEFTEANTRKQIEVCTAQFFAERTGFGVQDEDPIFILGLPRSGSTLIEQILASHSAVEGTQELPDIPRIVLELDRRRIDCGDAHGSDLTYPAVLGELECEEFRALGERYLGDTRAFRGDKPFFIDKMPNNFRHIALIHLMLPNARIIDVRREPMACCFSNLKQLFASGQEFTYGVEDIARYYRTYLELMKHWDEVLPGRILRVVYEDVVDDLEANVRRMLKFCGLEFERGCVEFYKTERNVATPSSEQVRQPIFREGLFQWRNYEPWLSPLEAALGDALIRYRE
jgi:tetratricopeptide (TPR) repeat protein